MSWNIEECMYRRRNVYAFCDFWGASNEYRVHRYIFCGESNKKQVICYIFRRESNKKQVNRYIFCGDSDQ